MDYLWASTATSSMSRIWSDSWIMKPDAMLTPTPTRRSCEDYPSIRLQFLLFAKLDPNLQAQHFRPCPQRTWQSSSQRRRHLHCTTRGILQVSWCLCLYCNDCRVWNLGLSVIHRPSRSWNCLLTYFDNLIVTRMVFDLFASDRDHQKQLKAPRTTF